MIGSIIGDIVGSVYEFTLKNNKTKDFQFFNPNGNYTDDTILTIATADWLLYGGEVAHYYSRYGKNYPQPPMGGYGGGFKRWIIRTIRQQDFRPYNSCGNGSAMRVGPVGWAFNTKEEVLAMAKKSAECTHNHPEGIKGAQATALAILMARQGCDKEEIRTEIEQRFRYNLQFTCNEIRPTYTWGGICQDCVPQAIVAFLDGEDFEDSIRNAISIGGDSDTIGCITGSIAEAYFGVPDNLRNQVMDYLPTEFHDIIGEFENKYGKGTYRNRPTPLSRNYWNILGPFVSDRGNTITLAKYNKIHHTSFRFQDVYEEKYVEILKKKVSEKVRDVEIEGLYSSIEGFLYWDETQETESIKIYNALRGEVVVNSRGEFAVNKDKNSVEELRKAYHNLCKKEDKAEYYNFLGIIYANDSFKDVDENTDPEYYFNIAAQKGSVNGAYNSAVWNASNIKETNEKYKWYLVGANKALNSENTDYASNAKSIITIYTNLAIMYHKGIGTEKNETEAEKWYKIAIEKGATKALLNLGVLYIEQGRASEAMELYAKAIRDDVTGWEGKQIKKIFMKLALNGKQFSQYYVNFEFNQMIKDL